MLKVTDVNIHDIIFYHVYTGTSGNIDSHEPVFGMVMRKNRKTLTIINEHGKTLRVDPEHLHLETNSDVIETMKNKILSHSPLTQALNILLNGDKE